MLNPLLGLIASLCRRIGWNALLLLVLWIALVCGAVTNLRTEAEGKTAPPPVEVGLSELSSSYVDRDVIILGTVNQQAYLKSGEYDKYYAFGDGTRAVLLRFNSSEVLPPGNTKLEGHVRNLRKTLQKALRDTSGKLGEMKVRDDIAIDIGFDYKHGGMPIWLNWFIIVSAALGIPLFLVSYLKGHVIFRPDPPWARSQESPSEFEDTFGFIGPLSLGHDRRKLFLVPAQIVDRDEARVITSQLRVPEYQLGYVTSHKSGEWTLAFAPDSVKKIESGQLFLGWRSVPALRFEVVDRAGKIPTKVCLVFSDTAQRQAIRNSLESTNTLPRQAPTLAPQQEKPSQAEPARSRKNLEPYVSPTQRFTPRFFIAAVALIGVGVALGMVDKVVGDFYRLLFVSPLLLGLAIGAAGAKTLELTRVRNTWAVWSLVGMAYLVALTTRFTWESQQVRPFLVEALSQQIGPSEAEAHLTVWQTLRIYMLVSSDSGLFVSDSHSSGDGVSRHEGGREETHSQSGFQVSGSLFWIYQIFNLTITILMATTWCTTRLALKPYCENCDCWLAAQAHRSVTIEVREECNEIVSTGQWERLHSLPPPGDEKHPIKVTSFVCPTCSEVVAGSISSFHPQKNVMVRLDEQEAGEILKALQANEVNQVGSS